RCRDPDDAVHARIDDLRRLQRDVAPGIDGQHPQTAGVGDVQPGHPVDLRDAVLVEPAALQRLRGTGHGDVAAGLHAERIGGGDGAADDVDVLRGLQAHRLPADRAALQVVDVVGVDAHQLPAGDAAGVHQVAAQVQLHVRPGQQRAGVVQVARA